jgi:hypothetical protein
MTFQYNTTDTSNNVRASPGTVAVNIIGVIIDDSVNAIAGDPRAERVPRGSWPRSRTLGPARHVCDTDVSWETLVAGSRVGTTTALNRLVPTCVPVPASRFRWTYGAGTLTAGRCAHGVGARAAWVTSTPTTTRTPSSRPLTR